MALIPIVAGNYVAAAPVQSNFQYLDNRLITAETLIENMQSNAALWGNGVFKDGLTASEVGTTLLYTDGYFILNATYYRKNNYVVDFVGYSAGTYYVEVDSTSLEPDIYTSSSGTRINLNTVSWNGTSFTSVTEADRTVLYGFVHFAALPGREGGQVLNGGTAASENLKLRSTTHATKGFIILGDDGSDVGIGTDTPTEKLEVYGNIKAAEIDVQKIKNLTDDGFVVTSGGVGTLAVDTTSYVPYTGATGDVDLGTHDISSSRLNKYAEYSIDDNSTDTTIVTAEQWQPVYPAGVERIINGFTFSSGYFGSITAAAAIDASNVRFTSATHELSAGDMITIRGTTSYNGHHIVTAVATDTFDVEVTWVADETGTLMKGDQIICSAGTSGVKRQSVSLSGSPAANSKDYRFTFLVYDYTSGTLIECPKCHQRARTQNMNEFFSISASTLRDWSAGDRIAVLVQCADTTAVKIAELDLTIY